jgi:hypothetical protein
MNKCLTKVNEKIKHVTLTSKQKTQNYRKDSLQVIH